MCINQAVTKLQNKQTNMKPKTTNVGLAPTQNLWGHTQQVCPKSAEWANMASPKSNCSKL